MPKRITRRQQRFLFSKRSPLTARQKQKMASEMRSGMIHVVKRRRRRK